MAVRVSELRESERCPVIGQTAVASPRWDNITSPETELTSRWCSNSRPFVEPMQEAKQMTTAQAAGAASHTPVVSPLPCELAADQYRVGCIHLLVNKAASSFFRWAFFGMLEPDEAKVSRPVLRGLAPSNGGWPLGIQAIDRKRTSTFLDLQPCRPLRMPQQPLGLPSHLGLSR